jgi:hypothetical protein
MEGEMTEGPDTKWQELIENYLSKLNSWQKIMLKDPQFTEMKITSGKKQKLNSIYKEMKRAEKELRDYEIEKGY